MSSTLNTPETVQRLFKEIFPRVYLQTHTYTDHIQDTHRLLRRSILFMRTVTYISI